MDKSSTNARIIDKLRQLKILPLADITVGDDHYNSPQNILLTHLGGCTVPKLKEIKPRSVTASVKGKAKVKAELINDILLAVDPFNASDCPCKICSVMIGTELSSTASSSVSSLSDVTENAYNCPRCNKPYKTQGHLALHLSKCEILAPQMRINCPHCNMSCMNGKGLSIHLSSCKAAVKTNTQYMHQSLSPLLQTPVFGFVPKDKARKAAIPQAMRKMVWDVYIGRDINTTVCPLCQCAEINAFSGWDVSHVIPEAHGGATTLENLRVVCSCCNKSMGTKNMAEFCLKNVPAALERLGLTLF